MNKKPIILRRDIVSRTMFDKQLLLRVVLTGDNQVLIDLNQNIKGRGAYLKKDKSSILLARKRNLLAGALRYKVNDSVYEELLAIIKD